MEQIHDRGNSVDKIEQIHIMLIVTYTKNDYIVSRGEIKKSKTEKPRNKEILEVQVVWRIKWFYITKALLLQIWTDNTVDEVCVETAIAVSRGTKAKITQVFDEYHKIIW